MGPVERMGYYHCRKEMEAVQNMGILQVFLEEFEAYPWGSPRSKASQKCPLKLSLHLGVSLTIWAFMKMTSRWGQGNWVRSFYEGCLTRWSSSCIMWNRKSRLFAQRTEDKLQGLGARRNVKYERGLPNL